MKVTIDTTAERRLWAFIRALDTEIGGWGYAKVVGSDLVWHEVFLIPQEVSGSEVDFEATGGDTAAVERANADGVLEDPSFVWVSWHSHHTMKAYWSKTDEARIAAMAKAGVRRLLSFVGSHDGSYRLRLDVFDVLAHGIALKQVSLNDLTLDSSPDDKFMASIHSEIAGNVKQIKTTTFLGHWPDSSPLTAPRQLDGEPELNVQEAIAVRDLTERGYSHDQAVVALVELGVDGVADLIEDEERTEARTNSGGKKS
jgi:hypothetical protein